MTDEEIRELLSKATPGPWTGAVDVDRVLDVIGADGGHVAAIHTPEARPGDAGIIIAAPDLAAEVLRLQGENKRLNGYHRYLAARNLEDCEGKGCPGPGREAEELRTKAEEVIACGGVIADALIDLLDSVDARDSLAYLEERDRAAETIAKLTAERDRLARILAVERGDVSAAPEGWERFNGSRDQWVKANSRSVWRADGRALAARWSWECLGERDDESERGACNTALEAMEAADNAAKEVK
jgi:hypothetical protein